MINIVLGVLFALSAVVFFVDFIYALWYRYCRFHIGRWNNYDEWERAVHRTVLRWVRRTPTVKITDNSRYMLLDILNGSYRSATIQSWQTAALILGLLESGDEKDRLAAQKAAMSLLKPDGSWRVKPTNTDCGMISFAILRVCDSEFVRPAMEWSLSLLKDNIHDSGMISYCGGKKNPAMYVDTIGLVCPFLCLYSSVYHEPEVLDLAMFQIKTYHDYGLLKGTCLPNHAFNIETKYPLGVYGWGRGAAWYVIGLMDSYHSLGDTSAKCQLQEYILETAEDYLKYQQLDGGFGYMFQRAETYDSSATAAMAWFYSECFHISGNTYYLEAARAAIKKLITVTRIYGAIDWCQGDTKGIGIFSQTYDIMPLAQGLVLRSVHGLKRHKK